MKQDGYNRVKHSNGGNCRGGGGLLTHKVYAPARTAPQTLTLISTHFVRVYTFWAKIHTLSSIRILKNLPFVVQLEENIIHWRLLCKLTQFLKSKMLDVREKWCIVPKICKNILSDTNSLKNHTLSTTHCHQKSLPCLVQASKTLPALVQKFVKTIPLLS